MRTLRHTLRPSFYGIGVEPYDKFIPREVYVIKDRKHNNVYVMTEKSLQRLKANKMLTPYEERPVAVIFFDVHELFVDDYLDETLLTEARYYLRDNNIEF